MGTVYFGLKGWKRTAFIVGLTAVVAATAAAIGYFVGPYVAKAGKVILNSLKELIKKNCCFVAGTPVSTQDGKRPIEEIKVGDLVYAKNPDTGQMGLKTVTEAFVREADTLYHVFTETEEIITTEEHPFWAENVGWKEAGRLSTGDRLQLQNGNAAIVKKVGVERLKQPVTVYNFEAEDWHTYFVGSEEILVHNKCSLTKIADSFLKQKGLNAHTIKYEILGKGAKISQYNLFYDKATGAIFILANGAKEAAKIATGYFIK
jgi:hypothetical protein